MLFLVCHHLGFPRSTSCKKFVYQFSVKSSISLTLDFKVKLQNFYCFTIAPCRILLLRIIFFRKAFVGDIKRSHFNTIIDDLNFTFKVKLNLFYCFTITSYRRYLEASCLACICQSTRGSIPSNYIKMIDVPDLYFQGQAVGISLVLHLLQHYST